MLKRIATLFMFSISFLMMHAQVTTSSITGVIKDANDNGLEGASVTATHLPSGSVYSTVSKKGGNFNLPALRIGGPYTLSVSYVGFQTQTLEDIKLSLGVPFSANIVMTTDAKDIGNVMVSTVKTRRTQLDKTGASTVVGQQQIQTIPTISRSISDLTKLTPQANGNNFAGRDARYNNIMVDGANLNNNFGLSNDPMPGGGNQPISLDAYDEIAVNIAPYDVRQSGFTGAGITAVTKSGTNDFHGTAYTYWRNEKNNGTKVRDFDLGNQPLDQKKNYGVALGGPIVKNKLFFFVNYDYETREFPGIGFSPAGGSGAGTVSTTHIDSLAKLSNYLKSKYGYETGAYDNFSSFQSKNRKILGKIDWNISNQHKLTLKYSDFKSENDVALNSTSVPNGGGFTPPNSGSLTRMPNNRFGPKSMSFANSNYGFEDVVRSASIELNSNFRGKFANQLLGSFTKVKSTRISPSTVFPFVDILNNNGQNYMSFGYEPYSYNNDVVNDIYTITNNFTWFAGKHTVTAGGTYEYQKVGNMFMAGSQSYYVFNSLADFMNNKAPVYFAYTYSLVPGQKSVYSAELKVAQLGAYIQDEWNINSKLKLTYGLRVDKPIYMEKPIENPTITALVFPDKNGAPKNYSTGLWPVGKTMYSPRVGFRYDIDGDKQNIFRGGTGIFTGKIPFVWLTNMPTNSGMYQFGASVTNPTALQNYLFNPNPDAYQANFPTTAGTTYPSNLVLIDRDFKFPQVWRTNLAFDKSLGNGWTATVEAIYTKDINAVAMRNANQKPTNSKLYGPDNRPSFSPATNASRRIYSNITNAIVLENTDKGKSFSFTAQLNKAFTNGFYGSIAYTYTAVGEVTANPGSQAASVWNNNPTTGTQNDQELAYSAYAVPHRLVGYVSYRKEYLKHLATTFTLFWDGSAQNNYSYVVNGDLNGDGNNSTDLMYVPNNPGEIVFENKTVNGVTFTAAQQSAAFFTLVENTPYLNQNKGRYVERNAAFLPWYNQVNFQFQQDLFHRIGKHKHTLRFSVDILNVSNLLNKEWGIRKQYTVNNPLVFGNKFTPQGQPIYTLAHRLVNNQPELITEPFEDVRTTSSTWSMQFGLRYIF